MNKKSLFIIIAVLISINAFALGLLNDVVVKTVDGKTQIVLELDKVANFTDFSITSPDIIVFDLIAIDNGLEGSYYKTQPETGVKSIELMKDDESNFLRIMIETDKRYSYAKEYKGNNIIITLDNNAPDIEEWRASHNASQTKQSKGTLDELKTDYLITMDVENADVVTLLRGIADYVGLNLIMSNNVAGNVTIHVKDVPWKDLFDMITRLAGLTYEEYPNMIRVGTFAEFSKEQTAMEQSLPLITKIYNLEFSTPEKMTVALKPLLTKRGKITVNERTNTIVIKDIQDVHNRIQSVIEELDRENLQVEIVVKVVEMTTTERRDLGIQWTASGIEVFGSDVSSGLIEPVNPNEFNVSVGMIRDFAQINAILDALEVVGKSKTLSNPRITASNNEEAEILGGKQFFVQTTDASGNTTSSQYTVGTILRVTPHVNSMKNITLDIYAELSTVEGETTTRPVINTTQAKTIQMVEDGETVVMGGFVISSETNTQTGIPFLRAIPILGNLFKSDVSRNDEKEVLIFITPHIVKDVE